MKNNDNTIIVYVYFAIASLVFGVILVFAMLLLSQYFGIDIFENWWMLILPVILAAILDIILIEIYRRRKKK